MKNVIAISAAILVSACSSPAMFQEKPDMIEIDCPDPSEREMLTTGATYRDLAFSRSEAIKNWQLCYAAVEALSVQ